MKIYLSRSATRAMALDHPIGDPTGGPAYGEKNDPISAAISIATMVGTGGAVMAGTATLFQGLAFAGAALSLTGNVTGNKTLSKLGMITGIAGGLGMLGEAAFGAASPSLGETFNYGEPAKQLAESQAWSQAPFDATDATRASQYATPEATPGAPAAPGAQAPGVVAPPAATGGESLASQIAANPNAVVGNQAVNVAPPSEALAAGGPPALTPATAANDLAASQAWSSQQYNPADATRAADFGYKPGGTSMMDNVKAAGDWMQKNPMLTMVGAQAVGGLTNWLSGKTDAEINALEAQTGYSNAKALEVQTAIANEKRRRANLNAGYTQVNAGIKVNPNAQIQQAWTQQPGMQQPAGLIAGARG